MNNWGCDDQLFPIGIDIGWGTSHLDPGNFERVPAIGGIDDTYVLDQEISVRRGRQNWQGPVTPANTTVDIWDPTGRFNTYCNERAQIGVPLRVAVNLGQPRLQFDLGSNTTWNTLGARPEIADLVNGMWVAFDVNIDPIREAQAVIYQGNEGDDDLGWLIGIRDQRVNLEWTFNGETTRTATFDSVVTGRQALAVRWSPLVGIAFLLGATAWGEPWTILDTQSFDVGEIWTSSADVRVGDASGPLRWGGSPTYGPPNELFRVEIRDDDQDDPVVAGIDFTKVSEGQGTATGYAGESWTLQPPGDQTSRISTESVRFCGPIVDFDGGWPEGDIGANHGYVSTLTASGPLAMVARMPPVSTPLQYEFSKVKATSAAALRWELNRDTYTGSSPQIAETNEDGVEVVGVPGYEFVSDTPWTVSTDPTWVNSLFGSSDHMWSTPIEKGLSRDNNNGVMKADVRSHIDPRNAWTGGVWVHIPDQAVGSFTSQASIGLFSARCITVAGTRTDEGSIDIDYVIPASGNAYAQLTVSESWSYSGGGGAGGTVIGRRTITTRRLAGWYWVGISHNGSNAWRGHIRPLHASWGEQTSSAVTWSPVGYDQQFILGRYPGGGQEQVSGNLHWSNMAIATGILPFWQEAGVNWFEAGRGWKGERAADRFLRIAQEADLGEVDLYPDLSNDYRMGPQPRNENGLQIMEEIASATIGVIQERRDCVDGLLTLRTGASIANRVPVLTLSGKATPSEFDPSLRLSTNIQDFANIVTVTNSSTQTEHVEPHEPVELIWPLSAVVNLDGDGLLHVQAEWRLMVASDNRPATSRIDIDLVEAPHLADRVLAVREGDVIRITDLPPQMCGGDLFLVVQGQDERWGPKTARVSFSTTNGAPWVENSFPQM